MDFATLVTQAGPASLLLVSVLRHALLGAVIFVRKEFAGHGKSDTVALWVRQTVEHEIEVDRRHDAVAELFLNERFQRWAVYHHQLIETVDRAGRSAASAPPRVGTSLKSGFSASDSPKRFASRGQRFRQFHLSEQRADEKDRRQATDLVADVPPDQRFLRLMSSIFSASSSRFMAVPPHGCPLVVAPALQPTQFPGRSAFCAGVSCDNPGGADPPGVVW